MTRPIRVTIIVTAVSVFVILLVAGAAWWAISFANVANIGKTQIQAGAARLVSLDATGAASQFDAAKRTFSRAKRLLGPDWFGTAVVTVPRIGHQYSTARALVAIGLDGSSAGTELAVALQETPAGSAGADTTSALGSLFAPTRRHVDVALAALVSVADRAAALDERGLVPPLARGVRSVKTLLRDAAPFLDRTRDLLQLEKYLLSSAHRVLVVSQNGAELRPTGGFSGSYGVIEFDPTGVSLEGWHDIYLLPDPPYRDVFLLPSSPAGFTPPRDTGMTSDYGFREANWWIDFPTSAQSMLGFWQDYRQPPVDGVVVVDTIAMEYLLEALGPIRVPSFSETFTAENLLTRLLYHTSVKGGEGRKNVLIVLAAELERRVHSASPGGLVKVALALVRAADSKHVQMYFTDPVAQKAVSTLGWSGHIDPPSGTTDLLVISNAVNLGSKINMAMKKTIDYEVALMPDRSAQSTLSLEYSNTGAYALRGRNYFSDWLRVSRAPGTAFARGGGGYGAVEFGLPTEVRTFSVFRGQTRDETVVSRVPAAWRNGSDFGALAPPVPNGHDSSRVPGTASLYKLYVVRQADLEEIPTTVSITPPPGFRVASVNARLTASGAALPATIEDGRARLAVPLSGDVVLDVLLAPL